jgi:1-acyl-sn-glycerol-3-phosphate acyltransferase
MTRTADAAYGEGADRSGTVATIRVTPVSPRRAPLPDVPMRPRLYRALRVIARSVIGLVLDVRVGHSERVPSTGPVLLAGNHRGFLDGPLVAAFVPRPASFLAKSELFRGWLVRPLGWLGQIPVDRGRADRQALQRASAVLGAGGVLGMFPEGTCGAGELESVQHGIAYVALRHPGVLIVPVACLGTEQAMPKGSRLPKWRARVDIVFGAPFTVTVPANPRARSAVAAAAEEIRAALAAHIARATTEAAR